MIFIHDFTYTFVLKQKYAKVQDGNHPLKILM